MNQRSVKIANIAALAAFAVAVINLIIFREVWILVVAMVVLVGLAVYSVTQKRKLSKKQGSG